MKEKNLNISRKIKIFLVENFAIGKLSSRQFFQVKVSVKKKWSDLVATLLGYPVI